MDWYYNTHFSDPDDDEVYISVTCQKCGASFEVLPSSLIDGQVPGGELCSDCETQPAQLEGSL